MSFSHVSLPVGKHYIAMRNFYASALKPLGYEILAGDGHGHQFVGLGITSTGPNFWLGLGPNNKSLSKYDGALENRVAPFHVAFNATSPDQVDKWYQAAMYDSCTCVCWGDYELTVGLERLVASIMEPLGSVSTLRHFMLLLCWIRWETMSRCCMVR